MQHRYCVVCYTAMSSLYQGLMEGIDALLLFAKNAFVFV